MINCERIDCLVRRSDPVEYARVVRLLPPTVRRLIEGPESEVLQGYRLKKRQVRPRSANYDPYSRCEVVFHRATVLLFSRQ